MFGLNPLAIKGIIGAIALVIAATIFFRIDAAFERVDQLEQKVRDVSGFPDLKGDGIIDELDKLGRDRAELYELERTIAQESITSNENRRTGIKASESALQRSDAIRASATTLAAQSRAQPPNPADCGPSKVVQERWK